ncbi:MULTISPECIES: penicillin-binding transpeptidase domain-containing protein [Streptomyces]|uniref:Penicillin-binding protein n=1 Tax=Streptomyces siderophoricus TaxID=2802281 RepID=A0ABS1N064_9ACTN|nr:penicillin-binding transpeptidase domain-containing protein [Streptomyces sp. 9-7]MBL1093436.1 penicillin-binding protein [Streptomyces sp. 9-7]
MVSRGKSKRSGAQVAVIAGAIAATVGAGGYGAYSLMSTSDTASGKNQPSPVKTGPPSPVEVRTTARDFLSAWAAGDPDRAAALTDDRKAAATALTGYRKDAHIAKVPLRPGRSTGTTVPFSVSAEISYEGKRATWTYESELGVVREKKTGKVLVGWRPTVVHPELRSGDTLKTGRAEAPPIDAVDRHGAALTEKVHPALREVLSSLRERYGDKAGGTAGVELWIARHDKAKAASGTRAQADGKDAERPDETLKVVSKGRPGTLRTTLDSKLQTVTEKAVGKRPKAAAVVLDPGTGEILAAANSPARGFNTAFQGSFAPGSTMKVISSALLIDKGLAAYGKPHPCPKYATYGGWKFHNDHKFEIKNGTFEQSFARSCNTAFISQAEKLDDELAKEARDVFGIGLTWRTGVPSFDGAVPVPTGASKAASLIGQGGVWMNPLTMASVAATVRSGAFHQPYLVDPSVDKRQLAKASRPLSADTAKQLRSLMRLTATSGTGAEAMAGLDGKIGAKTGSAEVDGQKKPNGWFTAYRNDLAAAAVVPEGGHGGSSAGPIVAHILRSAD